MLSVSLQRALFICLSGITCVGAFISLRGTINKRMWKERGKEKWVKAPIAVLPVYMYMCMCVCVYGLTEERVKKLRNGNISIRVSEDHGLLFAGHKVVISAQVVIIRE